MDLIIDGYNLIGSNQGLNGALEQKRNWLIQQLSAYQRRKPFNLVVVFDGWRAGQVQEVAKKNETLSRSSIRDSVKKPTPCHRGWRARRGAVRS